LHQPAIQGPTQIRGFAAAKKKSAKKDELQGATQSGKDNALNVAISQIEKTYGKGSIMQLGSRGPKNDVDVISTGSLSVDMALGIGGLPRG
jgi:recombination protein RecA